MPSVNQATVIGFLGEDPKIVTAKNGRKLATFSVATTEKGYTSKEGIAYPDRTEWHSIILWGRLAEVAEKFLRKGSCAYVQGKLRTRAYDDKQGVKRFITEIEGEAMQLLDRRPDAAGQQPQTPISPNAYKNGDDMPF